MSRSIPSQQIGEALLKASQIRHPMVEPDVIGSNDPLQLEKTALLKLEMKEALSKRMIL